MEENGFGRAIRDSLVEKYVFNAEFTNEDPQYMSYRIWEGTTTVLALDVARAARDPATISAFVYVSPIQSSVSYSATNRLLVGKRHYIGLPSQPQTAVVTWLANSCPSTGGDCRIISAANGPARSQTWPYSTRPRRLQYLPFGTCNLVTLNWRTNKSR